MTIFQMLGQSGVLALMGMGTVFLFLVILVFIVGWLGKAVHSLGWDRDVVPKTAPAMTAEVQTIPKTTPQNQNDITAAIAAAITRYRNRGE
jgi:sodium pump decarboxylase gamma subunit